MPFCLQSCNKPYLDDTEYENSFTIAGKAKLEGLSGVDGTGRLDINQDGAAEWLIVPYQSAAPERDIRYDIGGTLVYGVGGENLTVPLFPDTITVKPDPRLHLRYFLKKFIQSDDPFTKGTSFRKCLKHQSKVKQMDLFKPFL